MQNHGNMNTKTILAILLVLLCGCSRQDRNREEGKEYFTIEDEERVKTLLQENPYDFYLNQTPYRELVNITPETCSPSDEFPWDILDPDQFSLDCPQGMGALAMDNDMEYNANNNIPTTSRSAVSESGSKPGNGYYMMTGQDTDNPAFSESLLKKASREEMLKSQKVRFLYRIR